MYNQLYIAWQKGRVIFKKREGYNIGKRFWEGKLVEWKKKIIS